MNVLKRIAAAIGIGDKRKAEQKRQAEEAERVFKEVKAMVEDKTSSDFVKRSIAA